MTPTQTRATAARIRRGIAPIRLGQMSQTIQYIDLNSQVDHSTTVYYGALDDDSTTASEWSGLEADSLKRSFVQKQVRVGGYDGNEGFAQKQGYVYSHNNSKNFVVYDQAESKESHGGHAKHVKVRGHRSLFQRSRLKM